MKPISKYSEEESKRIFWVIQTVFGFIIASSFFIYGEAFIPPYHSDILTLSLSLICVYAFVLWSWIDYSFTTIVSPYRFKNKALEKYRFAIDLFIVLLYSYLLLYIGHVSKNPNGSFLEFFIAFPLIFIGYIFSGALRIAEYGRKASRIYLIIVFMALFATDAYCYYKFYDQTLNPSYNRVFIIVTIGLTIFYRLVRVKLKKRSHYIAIDIDGVIANQIAGILPIIENEFDVKLSYTDITSWDHPIADTDIAKIIVNEQKHKSYIMNMPQIENSKSVIDDLFKRHYIAIATARPIETDKWNLEWLRINKIPYDEYFNLKEGEKQNADMDLDILIDDYTKNIFNFLEKGEGKAILFSQPWNLDHPAIQRFIDSGRLKIAESWDEIPKKIDELL